MQNARPVLEPAGRLSFWAEPRRVTGPNQPPALMKGPPLWKDQVNLCGRAEKHRMIAGDFETVISRNLGKVRAELDAEFSI